MLDIKKIAYGISNSSYANNLQATKELVELFDNIGKKKKLITEEDYIKLYDDSFYTYRTWEALVESEKEQPYGFTEEECRSELGKTIWQLPCGWFVQYV